MKTAVIQVGEPVKTGEVQVAYCKGLEGSGRHWAGTACLLYKTNLQHIEKFVIFLHHYVPVLSIVKIICSRGANLKDTVLQQVYSAKCLISHR